MLKISRIAPYALGILVVVFLAFSVFKWGQSSVEPKFLRQQQELTEEVIDNVAEGQREFREANPDRDSNISLERLRRRQAN